MQFFYYVYQGVCAAQRAQADTGTGIIKTNVQSDAFYVVLLLSIVSVIIDLVSSTAMNMASNWWVFQITMTVYVVSMPLLAATWVGYAYVLIHKDDPLGETLKKMTVIMLPYAAYSLLALTPVHGSFLHAFRKRRIQKRSPLYARGSRLYYAVFLYRTYTDTF